jgi:hypothetical protein
MSNNDSPKLLADLAAELSLYLNSLPYPAYRQHLSQMLSELVSYHHDALPAEVQQLAGRTLGLLAATDQLPPRPAVLAVAREWEVTLRQRVIPHGNASSLGHVLSLVESEVLDHSKVMGQFLANALTDALRPLLPGETGPDPALTMVADPCSPDVQLLQRFVDEARAALSTEGLTVRPELARLADLARYTEPALPTIEDITSDDIQRMLRDIGMTGGE